MLEIISMLGAKRSQFIPLPPGKRRVTPEMVASACAGMRPIVFAYSLAVAGGHKRALQIMRDYLSVLVRKELGDSASDQVVAAMADLVFLDITSQRKKPTVRYLAEYLGVSEYRWRKSYARPWRYLLGEMQSLELEAEDHLRFKLWGSHG